MGNWNPSDKFKEEIRVDAVRIKESVVNILASELTQFLKGDGTRVACYIVNNDTVGVNIAPSRENVAGPNGFKLAPGGGMIEFNIWEDGPLATYDWWAYSAGTGLVLYILEVVRIAAGIGDGD